MNHDHLDPPTHERASPRYFGRLPRGLVGALALLALGAAAGSLVAGSVAVGLVLLVAAAVLGALYAEQGRHGVETRFDRATVAALYRVRGYAGFGATAGRVWSAAGRELSRSRFEARALARRRKRLQFELGGAVHGRDETRAAELDELLTDLDRRLRECVERGRAAVERARQRTAEEKVNVASTQVRDPGS
jgi:hypothetical protein